MSDLPENPFGHKLRGRRAIAAYYLQDESPRAQRRISALLGEVRAENRLPHFVDGDGQPTSFTKWLDDFQLTRAKHLAPAASL
jgi:hypothetical protein